MYLIICKARNIVLQIWIILASGRGRTAPFPSICIFANTSRRGKRTRQWTRTLKNLEAIDNSCYVNAQLPNLNYFKYNSMECKMAPFPYEIYSTRQFLSVCLNVTLCQYWCGFVINKLRLHVGWCRYTVIYNLYSIFCVE